MSDHLNAMHARLAFLGEWCTPNMCLVFSFLLYALTAAQKKWSGVTFVSARQEKERRWWVCERGAGAAKFGRH